MANDNFLNNMHCVRDLFSLENTSHVTQISGENARVVISNPPDRICICASCKNSASVIIRVLPEVGASRPTRIRPGNWICMSCISVFEAFDTIPVAARVRAKVDMVHQFSDPVVFELTIEEINYIQTDPLRHTATIPRSGYQRMVENGLDVIMDDRYEFVMMPGDFRSISSIFVLEDEELASEPGEDASTDHSHTTIG